MIKSDRTAVHSHTFSITEDSLNIVATYRADYY